MDLRYGDRICVGMQGRLVAVSFDTAPVIVQLGGVVLQTVFLHALVWQVQIGRVISRTGCPH